MQTSYYTFWSLLTNETPLNIKRLQVPIIQRDYAQGRQDAQATGIRTQLLAALYEALDQQRPLTLDFVYGELDSQSRLFAPLDGQQRLTTLFLLHWYLALVAGQLTLPDGMPSEVQTVLSKFSYETRSSAREFCQKLVEGPLHNWQAYPQLSAALRDMPWYQPAWKLDPTVDAMLTMLDALAEKFGRPQEWFARLTDEANPLIGFYFLDMQQVGLTDDLYLKMNARGKPLTSFENWKAQFDLLLQQQSWPSDEAKELQQVFGRKTDGRWTDFFWKHRQPGVYVVDEGFGRYLHFLTRMLAYQSGEYCSELAAGPLGFEWFDRVYAKQENVRFLFQTLDFLARVQKAEAEGVAGLLGRLFTKETDPDRVRLFGNSQPDIFGALLVESDPGKLLQEQVLLFGLLTYGATVDAAHFAEADVRSLLRVLRNLLERTRQSEKDTRLVSDLRVENLPAFAAACAALATATGGASPNTYARMVAGPPIPGPRRGVEHERRKAELLAVRPELAPALHELENQSVFRGDLHNLLLNEHADQLPEFARAVREIWSEPLKQDLIIRAWLTVGDYALKLGRPTQFGEKLYFGNKDHWYALLAHDSDKGIGNMLPEFLQTYTKTPGDTPPAKLEAMITNWLDDNHNSTDWHYYFVKYPEMTQASQAYFAWASDFQVRLLRSNNIGGKHINPYVRAILLRGKVANGVAPEYEQWVNDRRESPLWLHNIPGISPNVREARLYCKDQGWQLTLPEHYRLSAALQTAFSLQVDTGGSWLLRPTASQDRIEQAEAFVAALQEQGVEYSPPSHEPLAAEAG